MEPILLIRRHHRHFGVDLLEPQREDPSIISGRECTAQMSSGRATVEPKKKAEGTTYIDPGREEDRDPGEIASARCWVIGGLGRKSLTTGISALKMKQLPGQLHRQQEKCGRRNERSFLLGQGNC